MKTSAEKNMWQPRIQSAIEKQREKDRYRHRVECQQQGSTIDIIVEGEAYLNFSSNDYLGLAHHPQMIKAAQMGAQKYGVGSGGSSHVTGYSEPLQQLEATLADWLGYDAAIVYPSGFTANQAVIKLMIERGDHLIADRLSHASLLEAAMFSEGRLYRYKHNDLRSLESYLQKVAVFETEIEQLEITDSKAELSRSNHEPSMASPHLNLVITEGIFSMDGDSAPLEEIAALAHQHQALLMVDDAHGIGILGEAGKGTCNHFGIHPDILVVTFGKAFGCSGAAVLMSQALADYFVQFSRPLIYSTAIAPMQAAILLAAVDIVRGETGMLKRIQLQRNILYFKSNFQKRMIAIESMLDDPSNLEPALPYLLESESAIQPLIIGKDTDALRLSAYLKDAGIWVSAIRPPTIPPNTARLRITLTADHTKEMIDHFLDALEAGITDLAINRAQSVSVIAE